MRTTQEKWKQLVKTKHLNEIDQNQCISCVTASYCSYTAKVFVFSEGHQNAFLCKVIAVLYPSVIDSIYYIISICTNPHMRTKCDRYRRRHDMNL